jgi:hypothetical protein
VSCRHYTTTRYGLQGGINVRVSADMYYAA